MIDQTKQMPKPVYNVMQGWEIKDKNKKQQWCNGKPMMQSPKCNAPPNWHIRWPKSKTSVSKCKGKKDLLVNSWGYSNVH